MKKIFVLIVMLSLLQHPSFSQSKTMDSLKTALLIAKYDTTRLRLYLALGDSCERKDNLLYAEPAVDLADKLLSLSSDDNQREKILQQKSKAYDLIVVYYSKGNNTDWNKVIEFIEKRLKAYQQAGNKKRIGEAHYVIANMYYYKNDTLKFLEHIQNGLAVFREIKDTLFIDAGYGELIHYYLSIGNSAKALESVQSAITICSMMNYKRGTALSLAQLGDMYRDNGANAQALENYQNALSILKETKDTNDLFNVMAAMGGFYYTLHNVDKAIEYYNKLIELCNAKKDLDHNVGSVYKWMGIVYRDNNDYIRSLLYFKKSLSVFDSTNNKPQTKDVLDEMGTVYSMQSDFANAIEYHLKSLKIAEEIKSETGIAWTHHLLAQDYLGQKKFKSAEEYNNRALAVLKKQFDVKSLSETELLAAQIDSANGYGTGAYEHYKQYIFLSNKLKGDEIQKAAQKEKFKNEFDKQKAEQEKKDAIALKELQKQKLVRNGFIGGFAIVLLFAGVFFTQRNKIKKEKKRSDELLLNILPEEVAEELKAKGSADAKQFDEVSVLFTDFKGFTQLSEKLSPQELVAEINECFSAFDHIMQKHGVEKIKTIGDSYMAAGGLPTPNKTHAEDVVRAALEIRDYMSARTPLSFGEGLGVRLGIHTGPVVAGIVGVKKFAYDIWGDTVNTASRMESSGEIGKVNISETTYELVKGKYNCVHRGKIIAKGKGEIDMYFIDRK